MRSSRERSEHRYVGSGWFVYRVLTGSVPVWNAKHSLLFHIIYLW
jgi:hypothetical protein